MSEIIPSPAKASQAQSASRADNQPMPLRLRLSRAATIVALAYAIILVLLMTFEDRLIFFPAKYFEGNWESPGLPVEDAQFSAADGTKLHGWFLPHDKCPGEQPAAVVLVAHGNAGNLTHRAHLLRSLRDAGAAAMVFDYRGYGKSEGTPSEEGVLADARAARAWLAQRTGVAERDIVLFGESLGSGVVVDLAASDGARGLILLGAFTSLPDVAAKIYPWIPVRLLMRTRLDSLSKIDRYDGPVLQLHGDRDEIIPYELGQRLFEAARDPNKQFVTLRGATHNAIPPKSFDNALARYIKRLQGLCDSPGLPDCSGGADNALHWRSER